MDACGWGVRNFIALYSILLNLLKEQAAAICNSKVQVVACHTWWKRGTGIVALGVDCHWISNNTAHVQHICYLMLSPQSVHMFQFFVGIKYASVKTTDRVGPQTISAKVPRCMCQRKGCCIVVSVLPH